MIAITLIICTYKGVQLRCRSNKSTCQFFNNDFLMAEKTVMVLSHVTALHSATIFILRKYAVQTGRGRLL
jgi:hypothetical protein